jgi:hypothetical protein
VGYRQKIENGKMHPEFFAFDVTHQTNQEKRDMFVGVGKDGNNKAFHGFHALLPSQKRWVHSCPSQIVGITDNLGQLAGFDGW